MQQAAYIMQHVASSMQRAACTECIDGTSDGSRSGISIGSRIGSIGSMIGTRNSFMEGLSPISMQHTAGIMRRAACRAQRAACSMQHALDV